MRAKPCAIGRCDPWEVEAGRSCDRAAEADKEEETSPRGASDSCGGREESEGEREGASTPPLPSSVFARPPLFAPLELPPP